MTTYFIISLLFFVLGFVFSFLTNKFWMKKKALTEEELRKLRSLIQDQYLKTEDKVEKIIEIIKS